MVDRVLITEAAARLIPACVTPWRPVVSPIGGRCDGSAPMCYPVGEFRVGGQDVHLGSIEGCPFYIGAAQFEYWQHTQLIIDVVTGRGSGFSLEAPLGVRFLTRSRLFTDAEVAELELAGYPPRGDQVEP